MKKLLSLAAICLFSAYTATAQDYKKVTWGLRLGANIASMSNLGESGEGYNFKNKVVAGVNVGAIVDVRLHKFFAFQTGLYYSMQGGKAKVEANESPNDNYMQSEINTSYLKVPLLASFRYDFKTKCPVQMQISTGPYLAVAIGGKQKFTGKESGKEIAEDSWKMFGTDIQKFGENEQYEEDMSNHANRGDIGWVVDLGFVIAKHYYIGASYNAGLVNIDNGNGALTYKKEGSKEYEKTKNSVISVSIGYNF